MVDDFSSLKDFDSHIKKSLKEKKLIQWLGGRKQKLIQKGSVAKKKGQKIWKNKGSAAKSAIRGTIGTTQKMTATTERFGYALPGPFQVFTLAWQNTSKALKIITVLVFALVLLFIPWGVFYYTGWAVGAAFMFLISLIYWVVINLFNGIAYVMVTIINGIASLFMGMIVFVIEAIFGALGLGSWENGKYLLANSLISYGQIANVPSLYHIVEPSWKTWMNDGILTHLLGLFGVKISFSWFAAPFKRFYTSLAAEQEVLLGLVVIMIPLVFLGYVYYKNRYRLSG